MCMCFKMFVKQTAAGIITLEDVVLKTNKWWWWSIEKNSEGKSIQD